MFDFKGYHEASSISEAVKILKEKSSVKVIAGGSDILIEIREHPQPELELVGIRRIEELKEIALDDGGTISIGSMVTFEQMEKNDIITKNIPVLGEAGGTIGGPQLRRVATIGGNICNGAVSADTATALFCFNARLELVHDGGSRIVPIKDFYHGPGRTDLKKGELLARFLISPGDYRGLSGHYIKFSRRKALDIANLACTALCRVVDGKLADVRIGLGVAAPTPIRCPQAEAFAEGLEVTEANLEAIGRKAVEDARPRDSWRASKAFRQQLIEVCTQRALKAGVESAAKKRGEQ